MEYQLLCYTRKPDETMYYGPRLAYSMHIALREGDGKYIPLNHNSGVLFARATENADGIHVAQSMGEDPACVYKTLVTQGASRNYFVFVIPVAAELDLKAAARSVGEKSVAMIHVADINKVTGYVRGGCSPVGMKKQYTTVFDESVLAQEKVYVSGGRIGTQVCCAPVDLIKAARATTAHIIF